MIITDAAKPLLEKVLLEDGKNTLTFQVVSYGCHSQLYVDTINCEEVELINGINVVISPESRSYMDTITIDVNGENLVFRSSAVGCHGGCGGCSGECDENEEGCCGGDCEGGCQGGCGNCQ